MWLWLDAPALLGEGAGSHKPPRICATVAWPTNEE